MRCPKCKTENPDNAASCRFCNCALPGVAASGPAQQAKTSGLATASLVLGILAPFTCFITAIPAIIFGIVALVKIGKGHGQLKGKGLAIAGTCVSGTLLILLPVFALLMGIMMPALARVRQVSLRMVCANNVSTLAKAMVIYQNDYNEIYPTTSKWCDLLVEKEYVYVKPSGEPFRCKIAKDGPCNYAMNINVEGLELRELLPDMVLLFETHPGWNQSGGPEILTTENHQDDGCNIAFVDGHVQFVRTKDLKNLRWGGKEDKIVPLEPPPLLWPPPPSPPPLRVVPLRGGKENEKEEHK